MNPKLKIGLLTVLIVVLVGGLGGAGFYFYNQYQHTQKLLKDPQAAAQEEIKQLVKSLSRHMFLDTSEMPTIAKVTDPEQLAENQFFAQAKEGDVVLIFQQSGKVILFRPDADRIVNIGPFTVQPEVAGTQSAELTDQLQEATLTILNSTSTAGLASVAETKIKAESEVFEVSTKANSKNDDYAKSVVVVLKPEVQNLGTRLAEIMQAEITVNLPEGEDLPETDLLLILGTDFKP